MLLFALLAAGVLLQTPPSPVAWLKSCTVAGESSPALCGTYEVWEDRGARRGRRIGLNVVVLPALSGARQAEPVFYLDGGPGGSAVQRIATVRALLSGVRDRDLVFVDVRGTGRSHPLDCPAPAPDAPLQDHFGEFLPDAWVRACRSRQNADVRLYTSPIAMDDLDEVRAALGYDRINLFGISGGTRLAQVYLRRHPESVRAAVMKGVAPMDMENPLTHAGALESGVRAVIAACAAEARCSRAYPNLAEDWERSKRRFDAGTAEAVVTDPRTGRSERVRFGRGTYGDGVRHVLYSMQAARRLPSMIHAAANGDFTPFAQRELDQSIGFHATIAFGAFLTATCSEDVRFIDEEDIRRATSGTFLGDYRVRRQQAACRIWGRGEGIDEDYQAPVRAETPALLISGEHDTATPPALAERVAGALPNARHVVFPNQSHDSPNLPCEAAIIAAFIAEGSAAELDTSCVGRTVRAPFVIAPQG